MAYDIFISYRRKGAGAGVAGELQAKLENRGYKVFLDVDEIGSGEFPKQIDNAIEECRDFLLVLSPGTLDHCVDEEDWVRREIVKAMNRGKNIVGVMLPGFVMPEAEALPAPLKDLPTRQVFLWTHEYRNASFAKIEENLESTKLRKKKNRNMKMILLPTLLALAIVGVALWVANKPPTEQPKGEDKSAQVKIEFVSHATKGMQATAGLSNPSNEKDFVKLMTGIAEYDSAIELMKANPNLIVDTFDVVGKRDALMKTRSEKFRKEIDDINWILQWGDGMEKAARQHLELAKVLSMGDDQRIVDSLERVMGGK